MASLYSVLRTPHSVRWIAAALAVTAIAGCQQQVALNNSPPKTVQAKPVQLARADGKALDDLIATHKGKVVLVDYWATWCGPCVENFPHTVALAKKYREQGLIAIAVSFDLLEDEARVREFLGKQGADFQNLISKHDAIGQKPAEDFNVAPLPEYRLYSREGKLEKKWEGGVDQAELEKAIEVLLQQKA